MDFHGWIGKMGFADIFCMTVESKTMIRFFLSDENHLTPVGFANLIAGSPKIDLEKKLDILYRINFVNIIMHHERSALSSETAREEINYINELTADIKSAIENLVYTPGGLFTVSAAWYDEDIKETKYGDSAQPCADYEKVLEYIEWSIGFEELDKDSSCWYQIEKWMPGESGRYIKTYIYQYIPGVGICLFTSCEESGYGVYCPGYNTKYSSQGIHLNLPTPFKPGDIVTIDCRPFAPPINALIVYAGPDWDCCSLLALYRDEKGRYRTGAVKHADMWALNPGVDLYVSPLYRLEYSQDKSDCSYPAYEELSAFINGDNERGDMVYDMINSSPEIKSPRELIDLAERLAGIV